MNINQGEVVIKEWVQAAIAKDGEKVLSLLSDSIVVLPPFQDGEVHGPKDVLATFSAFATVTENFQYGRSWHQDNSLVLEFSTSIDGAKLHGVDIIELDHNGKISRFDILARPVSAVQTLGKAVQKYLGQSAVK